MPGSRITSEAYRYWLSNIPSLTNPFVVIQKRSGCSRAPIDCFTRSYISLFLIAANSSITPQCVSSPSKLFVLLARAFINPIFSSQYKSAARFLICFLSRGDCLRILSAALNPSLAWSNIVAMLYICGAPSLSLTSISNSMAAVSVVFPFFLPSIINTSLYCLNPLSSTKPNIA